MENTRDLGTDAHPFRRSTDNTLMRVAPPSPRPPSSPRSLGSVQARGPSVRAGGPAAAADVDAALAYVGATRSLPPATPPGPVPAGQTVQHRTALRAEGGSEPAKTNKLGEWIRRMGACGMMCAIALLSACSTMNSPVSEPGRPGVVASSYHDASRPASHRQIFASTAGLSTAAKIAHYESLLAARGYQSRVDDPDTATVIGLRKPTPTSANHGNGVYDDGFVVLRTLPSGERVCLELVGNTEPCGNTRGSYGVDIDGDGRRDLGSLLPGKLTMCFSTSDGLGEVLRPVGTAYVARDVDWDGDFDEGGRHSAGRSVLFHRGGDGYTSSAACQTLPPDEWRPFWDALTREARPDRIDYMLLVR